MKKIVCLFIAFLALMLVSCSTYQTERDIKKYEERNRKEKVHTIKVKQVENTCIYVAKIRYKLDYGGITVPVFHMYKWDKYGYIREMEDSDEKFETIEYYFPEAIYVDDYVIVKAHYQWSKDKTKDITYFVNKIKDGRK